MTPFGWAAERLAAIVVAEPTLLGDLFEISQHRMHLIALVLAHSNEDDSSNFGFFLFRSTTRAVLKRVLGRHPAGIRRALAHLRPKVLSPENYRRLVELLDDRVSAKILSHAETIDNAMIKFLHGMPPVLRRPAVLAVFGQHSQPDGFINGLRFLASRSADRDFEALIAELATVAQPGQFFDKLRQFIDAMPLPEILPPAQIGYARRLDRVAEIRALAKRWKNCLGDYAGEVDSGECAVYLWEDAGTTAACLVKRHGRFGWFLEDTKGPQNSEIKPEPLARIRQGFVDVGMPQSSIIEVIESILDSEEEVRELRRYRRELGEF